MTQKLRVLEKRVNGFVHLVDDADGKLVRRFKTYKGAYTWIVKYKKKEEEEDDNIHP